jgi:hypothetical protein
MNINSQFAAGGLIALIASREQCPQSLALPFMRQTS